MTKEKMIDESGGWGLVVGRERDLNGRNDSIKFFKMIEGRVLLYKKVQISNQLYLWRESDEKFQAGEIRTGVKVGTNTGVKTTNKQTSTGFQVEIKEKGGEK